MPGRKFDAGSSYRYGFNGKENDNEVKGEGTQQDYGMRIYDTRLGRFFSVDPITKQYPELTPYQFASNTPIQAIDLDGEEAKVVTTIIFTNSSGKTIINRLSTKDVKNPYRLGGGTLFETKIKGLRGVKDIVIYTYEPKAPENKSVFSTFKDLLFNTFLKDQDYPDDGGPEGSRSHQIYGIIFTSKDGGSGTTSTGTGNNATFYDVIDGEGLFGLVKGSGGGFSLSSDGVNKIISTIAKIAEEAKGAADVAAAIETTSSDNAKPIVKDTVKKPPMILGRDTKTGKPNHYKESSDTTIKADNENDPDTNRTIIYSKP